MTVIEENKVKIDQLILKNNIFLAPLAGVSDRPFRVLCYEQGAGLVYTEMISAKAISYDNQKTKEMLVTSAGTETLGIQLFGKEPEIMAESAQKIDHSGIALFDINLGCPVPKVVNNGEGSALMKNPKLIGDIVSAMVKHVSKPVTIKIRKGFDANHVNAVLVAKIAEASGAAAITVHGRTREQYYSGHADWEIIRAVKEAVDIPVIGNGDVFNATDAKRMLEETGCDGVMVARGAQGNPWIFREINDYLKTGQIPKRPDTEMIIEMMMRHKNTMVEDKGAYIALREMRKHVAWYTKGLKHGTRLRQVMNQIVDIHEFDTKVREILLQ
ncbi:tRNA-dihydrouridine synthase B [Petrocella atlantisensis]|uniref:tRNA-dihydrouridine synthase n=1 Tax=Petrocella atlantisensis TaxID=2173034 RepID=A0A3P7S436_9FIRM|nr:tRNA dihydrouridine synthase DusB [Petrocella atlantisensis]VDN47399.1 tRNA-dihydrouridine synthase B [Petrocella atlantisensis]